MQGTGLIPIATAAIAILALVAIGALYKKRPAAPIWLLLAPVLGFTAIAAYFAVRHGASADPRALRLLRDAALGGVGVLSSAALVLGVRAGTRVTSSPNAALGLIALVVGGAALALVVLISGREPGVLLAATPSAIGVLGVSLGARAQTPTGKSSVRSRAAFEVLLVVVLALGAVALSAIAVATIAIAEQRPASDAERALARAGGYGLPPLLAAAAVVNRRMAFVGRGVVGRFAELGASVLLVVALAAVLRIGVGRSLERAAAPIEKPTPEPVASPARNPEPAAPAASVVVDAAKQPDDASAAESAEIRFGRVLVSGMLAPTEVRRHMERIRPRLEKCHASAGDGGGRQGALTVVFSIAGSGSVSRVQQDDSSITDEKLVTCILAAFYQIGFPQPSRGHVRVRAPIEIGPPLPDAGID